MDLLQLLIVITLAGICGALAEFIVGYSSNMLLVVVLVGVVGAFLGNAIAETIARATNIMPTFLVLQIGEIRFDVVWAVIGSCFVWLILLLLSDDRVVGVFRRPGRDSV